ncbi:MAG: AAA family ATPase, partial [Erysipelotrichaceae bacterium]|nr:AAA family ATPase [Erysipelotrichaceae bacterium]
MLAKEFRPRKFSEVIGQQKNILAFTKKAVEFDYPDVMFMVGPTGSGKTTSALIIGATVNCKNPIMNEKGYVDPCMECSSCKSVLNETFNQDIHFIKSSEMGKDDILELETLAASSPLWGGKKQVIIIDEAQNLTKGSKGATLNLLEKKRKDTIFILCTMDATAFDKSITSRGQVYTFKPLTTEEVGASILKQLELIDPEEKLPFDTEALVLLAQNSFGSARQACQYLDRCIDSELFTVKDIEKELSFISEVKAYSMVEKLLNKHPSFYDDLDTTTATAFYSYAWAVLASVYKSSLTLDQEDWKYKNSRKILLNPNYDSLIEAFRNINLESM